jgi:hypothetical protein
MNLDVVEVPHAARRRTSTTPQTARTWLRKVASWGTNLDHPPIGADVVEESGHG